MSTITDERLRKAGDNSQRSKSSCSPHSALHMFHMTDGQNTHAQITGERVLMRMIRLHSVHSIHS